jgi:hypothetical protein
MSAVLALIFFFGRDSEKFLCRQGLGMSDWIADHLVFSEQLELCVAKAQRLSVRSDHCENLFRHSSASYCESGSLLLKANFADLYDGRDVGVLGDVGLEDVGVGEKGVSECLDGFAGESADGSEGWQLVGSSAEHTDFDRDRFDGGAEQAKDERDVRVEVVVHVEAGAGPAGIKDGDLDHVSTIRLLAIGAGRKTGPIDLELALTGGATQFFERVERAAPNDSSAEEGEKH